MGEVRRRGGGKCLANANKRWGRREEGSQRPSQGEDEDLLLLEDIIEDLSVIFA